MDSSPQPISSAAPSACPRCGREIPGNRRCEACGIALVVRDYRILEVLSESPQGRGYVAASANGERVFLKELVFALVPDARMLDAFEREGELLRQLHHDAIPEYIAHFTDGEGVNLRLYLVERYLEGASLLEELQTRRYSEPEIRAIGSEILAILEYLHERSPPILHRDVKPANIIRAADGRLALVDFGAARDFARGGHGLTQTGTVGYAAPEQLTGDALPSSDVHGLAATLAHLLSRTPPWELSAVGLSIDARSLEASASFKAWLARALHPNPEKRFPSAAAARVELQRQRRPPLDLKPLLGRARRFALAAVVAGIAGFGGLRACRLLTRVHPAGTTEYCPEGAVLARAQVSGGLEEYCTFQRGDGERPMRDGVSVISDSGHVRQVAHYAHGVPEGDFVKYDPWGEVEEKGLMRAGKHQGRWVLRDEDGEFVDDKKTGPWTRWHYGRGRGAGPPVIAEQGTYRDGLREGVFAFFRTTGTKESEVAFAHDVKNGPTTSWYENGATESTGSYLNGKRDGPWVHYFPDGKTQVTKSFQQDRPIGEEKGFFADGRLACVKHHAPEDGSGEPSEATEYYPGGAIRSTKRWSGHRVMDARGYYKNGSREYEVTALAPPSSACKYVSYYESRAKKAEANIGLCWFDSAPDGQFEGEYREWYETSGVLKARGEYASPGSKHGEWSTYWPSGRHKTVERYDRGERDGLFREYYESGRLKMTGFYRHGRKWKLWVEYDAAGRTTRRLDFGDG